MASAPATPILVGRTSEELALAAAIRGGRSVAVLGAPGIGKSAWFKDPDGSTLALFQPE